MEISNLNFSSIFIFFAISLIVIYWLFLMLKSDKYIVSKYKWLTNRKYNFIKYFLLVSSFLVLLLSIFWIKTSQQLPSEIKKVIDIVFVLDVSKSMNVADIESKNYSYTRLDFAKNAIASFVKENPDNRYSLIIFAWTASSSVPLTSDTDFFLSVLNNVDYRNIPTWWSNFFEALKLAHNRLNISEDKSKAIIFISDAWDDWDLFTNDIKIKDYESLRDDNIEYYLAWVWTKEWWKIISWRDTFGRLIYQKYKDEYVISKLNEDNLKNLSKMINWNYQKLEKFSDINLFSKSLNKIEKKVIEENTLTNSIDFSRKLWIISFVIFMVYLALQIFDEKFYLLINKND